MYVLWNLTIRSYCCANCYDDAQIILKQCYKRDFVYYKKGDDKRRSGFSRNLPELGLIFHTLNWPSDWRLRTPSPKNVAYSKKRLRIRKEIQMWFFNCPKSGLFGRKSKSCLWRPVGARWWWEVTVSLHFTGSETWVRHLDFLFSCYFIVFAS